MTRPRHIPLPVEAEAVAGTACAPATAYIEAEGELVLTDTAIPWQPARRGDVIQLYQDTDLVAEPSAENSRPWQQR